MTPEIFAALHARAFTEQRPWSKDEFAALMADSHVFATGDARAAALGRVVADEAEVLTLAVDPDLQRQGFGRLVLAAYEAEARARGASRSFLEVAVTNTGAIALYRTAGYRDAGLRKNYAALRDGRRVDACVMEKTLT